MQVFARSTDANTELNGFQQTAVTAAELRTNKPPGLGGWENNVFDFFLCAFQIVQQAKICFFLQMRKMIDRMHGPVEVLIDLIGFSNDVSESEKIEKWKHSGTFLATTLHSLSFWHWEKSISCERPEINDLNVCRALAKNTFSRPKWLCDRVEQSITSASHGRQIMLFFCLFVISVNGCNM